MGNATSSRRHCHGALNELVLQTSCCSNPKHAKSVMKVRQQSESVTTSGLHGLISKHPRGSLSTTITPASSARSHSTTTPALSSRSPSPFRLHRHSVSTTTASNDEQKVHEGKHNHMMCWSESHLSHLLGDCMETPRGEMTLMKEQPTASSDGLHLRPSSTPLSPSRPTKAPSPSGAMRMSSDVSHAVSPARHKHKNRNHRRKQADAEQHDHEGTHEWDDLHSMIHRDNQHLAWMSADQKGKDAQAQGLEIQNRLALMGCTRPA